MIGCLSLYCFLAFGPPGVALDPGPTSTSQASGPSIQAYGRAKACAAWTDGCTVCTRAGGDAPASCSTPGIACTPATIACTAP